MSSPIKTEDLARIKQYLQGNGYPDTCQRLVYQIIGRDDNNQPIRDWITSGAVINCRISPQSSQREVMQEAGVETADDLLNVPIGTPWVKIDRLRVISKWGVNLDQPMDYEIIGTPEPLAAELVVKLRIVTNKQ